jgi:hypothetical protein
MHTYRLHWLLGLENRGLESRGLEIRGLEGEEEGKGWAEVRLGTEEGWIVVRMRAEPAGSETSLSVVRAGELIHGKREVRPFEGWVSPTYGVKIPALSVMLEVRAEHPITLKTEFVFPNPGEAA